VKNKEENKPRLQASRTQQMPADRVHLSAQTWFLFNHKNSKIKMNCHTMETTKEPTYKFPIEFHNPSHYCMILRKEKSNLFHGWDFIIKEG
jgi:hypothetical protein